MKHHRARSADGELPCHDFEARVVRLEKHAAKMVPQRKDRDPELMKTIRFHRPQLPGQVIADALEQTADETSRQIEAVGKVLGDISLQRGRFAPFTVTRNDASHRLPCRSSRTSSDFGLVAPPSC